MRNFLIIFFYLTFLPSILSCKSSEKVIDSDINQSTDISSSMEEYKGVSESISKTIENLKSFQITRFEPVYFRSNGKDTVVLQPVTITKVNQVKEAVEAVKLDTTDLMAVEAVKTDLSDQSTTSRKFEGFDILKSIVAGIVAVLSSPFQWILWILGLLLLIPLYRWIKSRLSKSKKNADQ